VSHEWEIVLGATKQVIAKGKADSFDGAEQSAMLAATAYNPTLDEHLQLYAGDGQQQYFCNYPDTDWEIDE
jgi:hypothetical protein